MDSLWLVVVGGLIAALPVLLGNAITQLIASYRENKLWEKQHNADKDKLNREQKRADIDRLRETYATCIHSLSELLSRERKEDEDGHDITDERHAALIAEANRTLALLALRFGNREHFMQAFSDFAESPFNDAERVRGEVIDAASSDPEISPRSSEEPPKAKNEAGIATFTVYVASDFRRTQFIKGELVPEVYTFDHNLLSLTHSQREILSEVYYAATNKIPMISTVTLFGPVDPKTPHNRRFWQARINPAKMRPDEIFAAWEKEYLSNAR